MLLHLFSLFIYTLLNFCYCPVNKDENIYYGETRFCRYILFKVHTDCRNSDCDGRYTNWIDQAPRSFIERCVNIVGLQSGRWDVGRCHKNKAFICEFGKINIILVTL